MRGKAWAQIGRYTSLAFVLPASTFAGYIIGYLLDKLFHTNFLHLIFLLLGVVGGFLEVLRTLLKDTQNDGR